MNECPNASCGSPRYTLEKHQAQLLVLSSRSSGKRSRLDRKLFVVSTVVAIQREYVVYRNQNYAYLLILYGNL